MESPKPFMMLELADGWEVVYVNPNNPTDEKKVWIVQQLADEEKQKTKQLVEHLVVMCNGAFGLGAEWGQLSTLMDPNQPLGLVQ